MDLTKEFEDKYLGEFVEIDAQLLRIDCNVPATGRVALCGGYLRDVFFQLKQPKDWDFAFTSMDLTEFLEVLRQYRARSPYPVTVEDKTKHGHYDEATGGGRILCVLGVKEIRPGGYIRDMDWILYAADIKGVMDRLDYCVNKFTASYDAEFKMSIQWHGAEWGVCQRNAESAITPDRATRFENIANTIGWEYRG